MHTFPDCRLSWLFVLFVLLIDFKSQTKIDFSSYLLCVRRIFSFLRDGVLAESPLAVIVRLSVLCRLKQVM